METFTELLRDAQQMLLDRSRPEADLIYYIAKLDDEARSAIVVGYRLLFEKGWKNEDNDS